jgi:hypothetical protein
VGRSLERTGLSSGSGRNNCLSKINHHRHQVSNQGLHRITKTNEQFPNGVLATCSRKWSSMTVPFIRKSTQRNSSWPGVSTLHTKAEYICADLSIHSSLFPCSQTADHTYAGTCRVAIPNQRSEGPNTLDCPESYCGPLWARQYKRQGPLGTVSAIDPNWSVEPVRRLRRQLSGSELSP